MLLTRLTPAPAQPCSHPSSLHRAVAPLTVQTLSASVLSAPAQPPQPVAVAVAEDAAALPPIPMSVPLPQVTVASVAKALRRVPASAAAKTVARHVPPAKAVRYAPARAVRLATAMLPAETAQVRVRLRAALHTPTMPRAATPAVAARAVPCGPPTPVVTPAEATTPTVVAPAPADPAAQRLRPRTSAAAASPHSLAG